MTQINDAVIKFRGIYALWSKKHGIRYNELLVLYTIREEGFCTQKQICDNYLLPRQTMNHVINDMCTRGLLELSPPNCIGREKAFVLSEKGKAYAAPLLDSLGKVEEQAIELIGQEHIQSMAKAFQTYSLVLQKAVDCDL